MARQRAAVQVNQFIGGIVTDSNPLDFPAQASIDEQNMQINRDGSRSRRLGFSPETAYQEVDTGLAERPMTEIGRSQYRWSRPGGYDKEFIVVQIGNYLAIHDLDGDTISGELLYSTTYGSDKYKATFSYAPVNGKLVVATNNKDITLFEYDGTSITKNTFRLKVRDFWGIDATPGGISVTEAENIQYRPTAFGKRHIYNLRNQTYALPRVTETVGLNTLIDPIEQFYVESGDTEYPSNADSAVRFIYADANNAANRTVDRYFFSDNYLTKPNTTPAPRGYFIIDALARGNSREEQEQKLRDENSELVYVGGTHNVDKTPGGASVVEEYAGRVWYAGFSGQITDGDSRSPSMSNYILYSQLVEDSEDIGQCYQEADPTSPEDSALVDTDGGFIRIDEVSKIRNMVALDTALFIFADNGVWLVRGADGDSFTPTGFTVKRLNNDGCVSAGSVVLAEYSIFYWGPSSIYMVAQDPTTGDWVVRDVAIDRIRELYSEIGEEEKYSCTSYYDYTNTSVRWMYTDDPLNQTNMHEIVFNSKFGAFTRYQVNLTGADTRGISSVSGGQRIVLSDYAEDVTVSGITVTAAGEVVTVVDAPNARGAEDSFYCIITDKSPTIVYTFGGYTNTNFTDWPSLGNIDTPAYIETGSITLGEPRVRKDVPYLTTFFLRTEESELEADNSSCFVRSKWDWTNAAAAYKWSNKRQAYRPQRRDDGQTMVATRNKIRGFGKSVAFRFESEASKNIHLYGWSFNVMANSEE